MRKRLALGILAALCSSPAAHASTPAPALTSTAVAPRSASAANPPDQDGVQWVRVPFEKAESQLLELFRHDLPKLEALTDALSIYEVRADGRLPADYRVELRTKLEQVLLTSKRLSVKQCETCEQSRVYRTEGGEVKYESYSSDATRPPKIATELGVSHFIYSEMSYTPEDLKLRIRLVDAATGALRWTREYSVAEATGTSGTVAGGDGVSDELGEGDSLSHVMIGEVAFTLALSPGVGLLPTVDTGGGAGIAAYPSADLFMGEKFDRGHKVFGLLVGAAFTMGGTGMNSGGTPLPWAMRLAPRFRYVFNPYNTTSGRWSVAGEAGAFLSTGLATAYVGAGPEMSMINRFSVSLTPVYIFAANVQATQTNVQTDSGSYQPTPSGSAGQYGGLGVLFKATINW